MDAIAAVLAGLAGRPVEARLAETCPGALHPVLTAPVPGAAPAPHTRTRLTVTAKEAGAAAPLLQTHRQGDRQIDRQETGRETLLVRHADRRSQTDRQTERHADRHTERQADRHSLADRQSVRQTGGRGPASGWPCMMQDSDAPHPPAGRGLCSRGSAAAPLQTSAGRRTPTSSSTAAHKQEVSSGHIVRTAHHLVCLRSVGKLTSTTVLLGHTCPCGCRQSKQFPWRGDSQSDHCLTVVSMTVLL